MTGEEFKHDPGEKWVDPYPTKKSKIGWFTGTIILLAIYVLSVGPAMRLMIAKKVSSSTLDLIYKPVYAFSEISPVTSDCLIWYVSLWMPKAPSKNS